MAQTRSKMQGWKTRDWKMEHKNSGLKNAGKQITCVVNVLCVPIKMAQNK